MQNQFFIPKGFEELIKEHVPEIDEKSSLVDFSKDQERAFNLLKRGKNVLVTGEAGTGKSYLIKVFVEWIKLNTNKQIYVTATTGIASHNILGITINSFTGIGNGRGDVDYLLKRITRNRHILDRLKKADILIIDEISMMSAELFEKLHEILCIIRKSTKLFGGIQLLISGDFLQLMPVFRDQNDKRLIFESELFRSNFTKSNTIFLEKNWRQSKDEKYSFLLSRLRIGQFTQDDISQLKKRIIKENEINDKKVVKLVSSNKKANEINKKNLDSLIQQSNRNEIYKYNITYFSNCTDENNPIHLLLKSELDSQLSQKDINKIILCKGVRVMLIKNINVEEGLVNGATGTIINFVNGFPYVKFDNGTEILIKETEWELELGDVKVTARQIPLMLAWSLTIHKSQSITLEKAIMDLSDCFTDAMVYVALSRVKSLDGLYLFGFNPNKITINEKTKKYLEDLRQGPMLLIQ